MTNKEHNWVVARVISHMTTAALFAANFDMPLDAFLKFSKEMYEDAVNTLNYEPSKPYPVATEE